MLSTGFITNQIPFRPSASRFLGSLALMVLLSGCRTGPMTEMYGKTFYLDGAVRHCGINSIELLKSAEGWKITQLSDTRRRENCPDPHGG